MSFSSRVRGRAPTTASDCGAFLDKKGFDAIKIYHIALWRRSQEVELGENSNFQYYNP